VRTVGEQAPERGQVAGQHHRPGRHRLGEHDAEALATGVRGDVDVGGAKSRRLVPVAGSAQEGDPVADRRRHHLPREVGVTPAHHEQPRPRPDHRHARERLREQLPALPGLAESADEGDGPLRPAPLRPRLSGREAVDVQAVGDDHRLATDMADLGDA